ncbi:MAG: DUF1858 domain-containing protein [Bacteroidota bacterium]
MSLQNKLNITPDTIVADLLNVYPQLEDKLIEIAPVFSKLKNPVLRKTIAKVTTLKQAAVIGKISLADLINILRKEVGQEEELIKNYGAPEVELKPEWVTNGKIKIEYDASIDLERGVHPVAKVSQEIQKLNENELYLLLTTFIPAPLIELVRNKGFETYTEKLNEPASNDSAADRSGGQNFATYIKKK